MIGDKLTLIYAGRRWYGNKSIAYAYVKEVDFLAEREDADVMLFKNKLRKYDQLGNMLLVEEAKTGVKTTEHEGKTGYHYLGKIDHEKTIACWTAIDRAAYDIKASRSLETKKVVNTYYDQHVEGIKYIMRKLPAASKTAFIAKLLKDLGV